jgi:hypothetical protein
MNDKNNWSYSFSWTQPYVSMNPVYQLNSVSEEIERLQTIDRWVDAMHSYPDAEEIISKVLHVK